MAKLKKEKSFTQKNLDGIKSIYENKLFSIQKPEKNSKRFVVLVILLALVFGLVAGFVGGGMILVTQRIKIPFAGEYNLEDYLPKREITIETTKDVTVLEETRVASVIDDFRKKTVDIYVRKEATGVLGEIVSPSDVLLRGSIISSDGWIVSLDRGIDIIKVSYDDASYVPKRDDDVVSQLHDYHILTHDGKSYPITKALKDPNSELIFLKAEATGLLSSGIAGKEDLILGKPLIIFPSDRYLRSEIGQRNFNLIKEKEDIIKTAESFSDFILLTQGLSAVQVGSPVADLGGSLIGLMIERDMIMPTAYIRNLVSQVLSAGVDLENGDYLTRPYLGIKYVDLYSKKGIYDERFKGLSMGALVYGDPKEGSPASVAGIRNADVILQVNGENVNGKRNLSEIIWQYTSGSTLDMKVLSGGEEKSFMVVLDELVVVE